MRLLSSKNTSPAVSLVGRNASPFSRRILRAGFEEGDEDEGRTGRSGKGKRSDSESGGFPVPFITRTLFLCHTRFFSCSLLTLDDAIRSRSSSSRRQESDRQSEIASFVMLFSLCVFVCAEAQDAGRKDLWQISSQTSEDSCDEDSDSISPFFCLCPYSIWSLIHCLPGSRACWSK